MTRYQAIPYAEGFYVYRDRSSHRAPSRLNSDETISEYLIRTGWVDIKSGGRRVHPPFIKLHHTANVEEGQPMIEGDHFDSVTETTVKRVLARAALDKLLRNMSIDRNVYWFMEVTSANLVSLAKPDSDMPHRPTITLKRTIRRKTPWWLQPPCHS